MKNSLCVPYEGFRDLSLNECNSIDGGGFKEGFAAGVEAGADARAAFAAASFLIRIVSWIIL